MTKNIQKGITLIALVITIIVLLILAGVTINAITGNENVMEKAREASDKTEIGTFKDEVGLVVVNHKLSTDTFENDLKSQFGASAVTSVSGARDVYHVTKNGNTLTVYENGDIVEGELKIWDGSTKAKPEIDENGNWHIYTGEQLYFFEKFVNKDTSLTEADKEGIPEITAETTVYLENDLDMGARQENGVLTQGTQWTPIGKIKTTEVDNTFIGSFDGQNHIISGIYVSETTMYAGLFGNSNIIENLIIKDSYIKNTDRNTGGIVGTSRGKILNCKNINTTVAGGASMNGDYLCSYTGGIAGQSLTNCIIEKCSSDGKVYGIRNEGMGVGGIVGMLSISSTLKECKNNSIVDARNCKSSGGVVGHCNPEANISKCYNSGQVNGNLNVGGICGTINYGSIIIQCYNKGKISGNENMGEIIGAVYNQNSTFNNLLWLCGVNNNLPAIGNREITTEQANTLSITSTDKDYTYEQFIGLWE